MSNDDIAECLQITLTITIIFLAGMGLVSSIYRSVEINECEKLNNVHKCIWVSVPANHEEEK